MLTGLGDRDTIYCIRKAFLFCEGFFQITVVILWKFQKTDCFGLMDSAAMTFDGRGEKMIIVYSKPACVQCVATTRELDKKGIAYQYIDLTEDNDAMATVRDMGYMQAPVVVAGDDHWAGFRPDKIGALEAEQVSATA